MDVISANPLDQLQPEDVATDWTRRGLDRISDAELLAAACELLTIPRVEAADSFALHAPLEVMARAELLPSVSPGRRDAARQRIAHIACTWATTGTPVDPPDTTDIGTPIDMLTAAIRDGDPATADRAFVALCAKRDQNAVIGDLADTALRHLGGAAHGPIFLELLLRFRPGGVNPALMARTLLRDIAAHPDWRLTWFEEPRPAAIGDGALAERLLAPHADRDVPNSFIYPTMSFVEETGLADELLADVTIGISVASARHCLLRIAAMSMMQDEPSSAPYGWSHCLTMPQAALAISGRASDPQLAIDVAATYVLGFRATQSSTAIDPMWAPDHPESDAGDVVGLDPDTAAAMAWHADEDRRTRIIQQLVDHAAPHRDAHLAKYTLACLDASAHDIEATRLYVAAAAYLAAWWQRQAAAET